MLTDVTFISLLLVLLLFPLGERCCCDGATVTWGQVNRYASTLHAQDVYLAADTKANYTDVVYGLTVSAQWGGGDQRRLYKIFIACSPRALPRDIR